MPITIQNGRQWPVVATVDFVYADLLDGVESTGILKLPINSIVLSGVVNVTEAWNSTTTDTITVANGGAVLAAGDLQATGQLALTPDGSKNLVETDVTLQWDQTGGDADTVGIGQLAVTYIIDGKANEVVPA